MKIVRLSESEFWDRYLPLCKPLEGLAGAEEQRLQEALEALDAKVRKALEGYDDGEDFELSDDLGLCWHHSIGIYGLRTFAPQFLTTIYEVLANETDPWCFHLACEPESDSVGGSGQLFVHQGEVFADASDDLDYSVFERS